MIFLTTNACSAIVCDWRGHSRSGQPSGGNEMDSHADDLATVLETPDLQDAVLVGNSAGSEDATRYIGRHGTFRVEDATLKVHEDTPHGLPIMRENWLNNDLPARSLTSEHAGSQNSYQEIWGGLKYV